MFFKIIILFYILPFVYEFPLLHIIASTRYCQSYFFFIVVLSYFCCIILIILVNMLCYLMVVILISLMFSDFGASFDVLIGYCIFLFEVSDQVFSYFFFSFKSFLCINDTTSLSDTWIFLPHSMACLFIFSNVQRGNNVFKLHKVQFKNFSFIVHALCVL